ncbi:MAG: caspase family protein, partial [Nonomuraea sp.]|nr:caspase family protein [Nonomuraea sp.]
MLGERRGARALLIGTGTHAPGSPLPGVPAVERNLLDLRRVLRERCGLPDTAITTLLDPPTMAAIGDAVADAVAASAERAPLLVYYAGHGLVSATGALYLAAAATDPGGTRLEHTALPFATLRRYLLDSRARPLVVVLDCCFSGRALTGLTVPEEDLAGLAEIEGGYVLTSAGRGQLALAPGGAEHTAFTGELLRTLEEGIPDGPRRLTLASLFRELSQRLPAGGFPSPHARWSARAAELALADNPGWPGEGSPREPDAEGQESVAAPPAGSPYRGLAAFGTEHEPLFFGRERVTARLAQECAACHDDQQPLLVM